MRRRVLNLVALLSLIPPAAVAVLCVRGYHEVDRVQWSTRVDPRAGRADAWTVISGNGVVAVLWERVTWPQALLPYIGYLPTTSRPGGFSYTTLSPADVTVRTETFWQRSASPATTRPTGGRRRRGPAARASSGSPLVPAAVFRRAAGVRPAPAAARATRRTGGMCATCGYDLRATPGRCPECGRAATGVNA